MFPIFIHGVVFIYVCVHMMCVCVCVYQASLHVILVNEIYEKKKRICQMEDKTILPSQKQTAVASWALWCGRE